MSTVVLFSNIILSQPKGFNRGMGVSPTVLTVQAKPGENKLVSFKLTNPSQNSPQVFVIEASDLAQDETGNILPVSSGLGTRSCLSWISVIPEIEIPPKSSEKIYVSVKCPLNAIGSYYALISLAPMQTKRETPINIVITPRITVRIEVIITGIAKVHLEPKELSYKADNVDGPPSLMLKIENTGLIKLPVEGDIVIYGKMGQFPILSTIQYRANGTPYEIYPGVTMVFECPLQRPLQPGSYRIDVRLRLTPKVESRKDFNLIIPGKFSFKKPVIAKAGEKSEFDVDLLINPDVLELAIPKGGFRSIPIRITNNDTRQVTIRARVTQPLMKSDGTLIFLESPSISSNWFSLVSDTLIINPKHSESLRLLASIPRDTVVKYPLINVVQLHAEAPKTKYHDDWSSAGEFASIIMITNPKTPPVKIEISNIELVRSSPDKNPGAAVVRIKNTGGKVAKIRGRLLLERKNGLEILHKNIGDIKSELIFPSSEREFRLPIGLLDEGDFRVRVEVVTIGENTVRVKDEIVFTSLSKISEGFK
jgi:hypothetical protein